jgi:hypothetical protein
VKQTWLNAPHWYVNQKKPDTQIDGKSPKLLNKPEKEVEK